MGQRPPEEETGLPTTEVATVATPSAGMAVKAPVVRVEGHGATVVPPSDVDVPRPRVARRRALGRRLVRLPRGVGLQDTFPVTKGRLVLGQGVAPVLVTSVPPRPVTPRPPEKLQAVGRRPHAPRLTRLALAGLTRPFRIVVARPGLATARLLAAVQARRAVGRVGT